VKEKTGKRKGWREETGVRGTMGRGKRRSLRALIFPSSLGGLCGGESVSTTDSGSERVKDLNRIHQNLK